MNRIFKSNIGCCLLGKRNSSMPKQPKFAVQIPDGGASASSKAKPSSVKQLPLVLVGLFCFLFKCAFYFEGGTSIRSYIQVAKDSSMRYSRVREGTADQDKVVPAESLGTQEQMPVLDRVQNKATAEILPESQKEAKPSNNTTEKILPESQEEARPSNKKVMIVDSIMYNGEPVVPVRLELLYDVVDRFYITESTVTFSNKPKPFYSQVHKDLFAPYKDKISWLVYEPSNATKLGNAWGRETEQRIFALDAMKQDLDQGTLKSPFVIVNTDADELPNPEIIKEFQPGKAWHPRVTTELLMLQMDWFCYNLDWKKNGEWHLGHTIPGEMAIDGTFSMQDYRKGPRAKRTPAIPNAGWHVTYFLGLDNIINKIESFSHQEVNKPRFKSREHIQDCIRNGKDLFNRNLWAEQMTAFNYTMLPWSLQKFHHKVLKEQNVTVTVATD